MLPFCHLNDRIDTNVKLRKVHSGSIHVSRQFVRYKCLYVCSFVYVHRQIVEYECNYNSSVLFMYAGILWHLNICRIYVRMPFEEYECTYSSHSIVWKSLGQWKGAVPIRVIL